MVLKLKKRKCLILESPYTIGVKLKKANLDLPILTENDRKVLREILDSKKVPDSDIAKTMNLSPQAIFKIRSKLEQSGIIKGYIPIIDYKKIGINLISVFILQLTSNVWGKFTDDQISEKLLDIPYIISAYRVSDEQASHILTLGFRDTKQKEQYFTEIQTKYSEDISIKGVYTFSVDKVLCHNSMGLLREIIDKKEFSPSDLF